MYIHPEFLSFLPKKTSRRKNNSRLESCSDSGFLDRRGVFVLSSFPTDDSLQYKSTREPSTAWMHVHLKPSVCCPFFPFPSKKDELLTHNERENKKRADQAVLGTSCLKRTLPSSFKHPFLRVLRLVLDCGVETLTVAG